MKQAKQIFHDAILLTAAAFLMRTAGVVFGVAVSRRAGAEAMGLFSLISGVHGFALTLATSGIQLGVTRVVTETISRRNSERVSAVLRRAILYALLCGSAAALLLFCGADFIGQRFLSDSRTVRPLRLFALTLPLISFSSVASGYFVAVRHARRNAAVQIFEQALKFGVTVLLLTLSGSTRAEQICVLLVLGGAVAETASFAVGLLLFVCDRKRARTALSPEPAPKESRELLRITIPVALTTYVRSGLVTLSHALVPSGLERGGMSHAQALSTYGIIHSMALPILLYPSALIYSFGGLVVPAMADGMVEKSPVHIRYMISRVLSLSMLFSVGVAGVLTAFAEPLGEVLYPGTETAHYLRLLAPLVPIMYVDAAVDSMLKGMGEQLTSMRINLIDALTSLLLIRFLVPAYGVSGYLFAIWFSECLNTVLSVTRLLQVGDVRVRPMKWVFKPLAAIVAATWGTKWLFGGGTRVSSVPSLCLRIVVTVLLYLLLSVFFGALDCEDLGWIGGLLTPCRQRNNRRACRPCKADSNVSERREKSATSECGFPSGSSCTIGTK